jgi:hypothetical protein
MVGFSPTRILTRVLKPILLLATPTFALNPH